MADTYIERQVRAIREIAVDPKTREKAWDLTRPANYAVRPVRRVIDGDCDFTEWGTLYELSFDPPSADVRRRWGKDVWSPIVIGQYDSPAEAFKTLTARSEALDGDDCADWVGCGVPAPKGFVP